MTDASLSASGSAEVRGTYAPEGVAPTTLKDTIIRQLASDEVAPLTFGTGAGQFDLATCSDRLIPAGAAATYDLYTGTDLKGLRGETCAFRGVKFLKVAIVSGGDAAGVLVGGAAANAWPGFFADASDKKVIFPGGPAEAQGSPAGVAVGAATKNLKVDNPGAADVVVRILIAGTSV